MSSDNGGGGAGNDVIEKLIDRLIYASDGSDARKALRSLIEITALSSNRKTSGNGKDKGGDDYDTARDACGAVVEQEACISCLLNLVATNLLVPLSDEDDEGNGDDGNSDEADGIQVDDGSSLGCDLILNLVSWESFKNSRGERVDAAKALIQHEHGKGPARFGLVHCLLDALSSKNALPFEKIQVISLLRVLLKQKPQSTQDALIRVPDGMHRAILEPAFGISLNNSGLIVPEETVRNETLIFAREFARKSPICRNLLIFSGSLEFSIRIAIELEGGLYNLPSSSAVIIDCLSLCKVLVEEDESGGQELLGSKVCMLLLMNILDVRNCRSIRGRLKDSKNGENSLEDEDMDDLLGRSNVSKKKKLPKSDVGKIQNLNRPSVTESEEEVIACVLDLLQSAITATNKRSETYLKGKQIRQRLFANVNEVCRSVLDLALFDTNDEELRHTIANPTVNIQKRALNLLNMVLDGTADDVYDKVRAQPSFYSASSIPITDRFVKLFLSCSPEICVNAMPVFRRILSNEEASVLLMHAIMPPPNEDGIISISPFQRLINLLSSTLLESVENKSFSVDNASRIISACGALGITLCNGGETVCELMVKTSVPITNHTSTAITNTKLVDVILKWLSTFADSMEEISDFESAKIALIRFMCEWCRGSSEVIRAALSSTENEGVMCLLNTAESDAVSFSTSLGYLLIGLCLDSMKVDESIGGWSRDIMSSLIKSNIGISSYIRVIEYPRNFNSIQDTELASGEDECVYLTEWYSSCADIVRRSLIYSIAEKSSDETEESRLAQIVQDQNSEINMLQKALCESENNLKSKISECTQWKNLCEARSPDEALSEQVNANFSAEIEKKRLRDLVEKQRIDFEAQLNKRQQSNDELSAKIASLETSLEEKSSESQNLAADLEALSAAYTNLEDQFRKENKEEVLAMTQTLNEHEAKGREQLSKILELEDQLVSKNEIEKEKNDLVTKLASITERAAASDDRIIELEKKLLNSQASEVTVSAGEKSDDISEIEGEQKELVQKLSGSEQRCIELEKRVNELETEVANKSQEIDDVLHNRIVLEKAPVENTEVSGIRTSHEFETLEENLLASEKHCNQLSNRIASLEAQNQDLTAQIVEFASANDKTADNTLELERLKNACHAADEWMAMAVERMHAMSTQNAYLHEINQNLTKATDQISDVDDSREGLLTILKAEKKAILEEKKAEIESLSEKINELSEDIATKESEFNKRLDHALTLKDEEHLIVINEWHDKVKSLDEESKKVRVELEKAQNEKMQVRKDLAEVESSRTNLMNQIEELMSDKPNSLDSIVPMKDFASLKAKANAMEIIIETLTNEKNSLGEKVADIQAAHDSVSLELTRAKLSYDEIELDKATADSKITSLESELASLTRTNESLLSKKKQVELKVMDLQSSYDSLSSELENVTFRYDQIKVDFDLQKSESLSLESQLLSLKETNEVLLAERNEVEVELKRLRSLRVDESLVDDLVATNHQADDSFDGLKRQLKNAEDNIFGAASLLESFQQEFSAKEKASDENRNQLLKKLSSAENERDNLASELRSTKDILDDTTRSSSETINKLKNQTSDMEQTIGNLQKQVEQINLDYKRKFEESQNIHQEEISELETQLQEFQEWTTLAQRNIAELEEEKEVLEQNISNLNVEIKTTNEQKSEAEDSLAMCKESLKNQELQKNELAQKFELIRVEKDDFLAKISDLENSNDLLSAQRNSLDEELESTKSKISDMRGEFDAEIVEKDISLKEAQENMLSVSEKLALLEASNQDLQRRADEAVSLREAELVDASKAYSRMESDLQEKIVIMTEAAEELNKTIEEKEDALMFAENEVAKLSKELDETIQASEAVVKQWKENSEALESQYVSERQEASDAITQWESRCVELTNAYEEIEKSYEETCVQLEDALAENRRFRETHDKLVGDLQQQLKERDNDLATADEEISKLSQEIDETVEKSEEVVMQWQACNEDLQAEVQNQVEMAEKSRLEFEKKMKEQKDAASDAIAQWEVRCAELSEQVNERTDEYYNEIIEDLREKMKAHDFEREEMQKSLKEQSNKLVLEMSNNADLKSSLEDIHAQIVELNTMKNDLEECVSTNKKTISDLSVEKTQLRKELEQVENSRKEESKAMSVALKKMNDRAIDAEENMRTLNIQIERLTGDLIKSQDDVKVLVTDNATLKATEVSSAALREQLCEVRNELDREHIVAETECQAREILQHQLNQLKDDFAFILKSLRTNGYEVDEKINDILERATQGSQVREKMEMEQVRDSLNQTMNELQSVTLSLHEVEKQEASLQISLTLSKQECKTAREELRAVENEMISVKDQYTEDVSLLKLKLEEYSTKNIQLDKQHREVVANYKAELSKIANTNKRLEDNNVNLQKEIKSLKREGDFTEMEHMRIEKAELLAKISKDASDNERRLRESVATCTARFEAEIITEKELRIAAEGTLEEMQRQLSEARDELNFVLREKMTEREPSRSSTIDSINQIQNQCNILMKENSTLKDKINSLEKRCQEYKKKEVSISSYTEEVEKERQSAEIALELMKVSCSRDLRNSENGSPNGINTRAEDMHDKVQGLKHAIEGERRQYQELMSEHENLLAVLAQQDLEKMTLCSALENVGGTAAVENAIHEAQQSALQTFGEYIQVTS